MFYFNHFFDECNTFSSEYRNFLPHPSSEAPHQPPRQQKQTQKPFQQKQHGTADRKKVQHTAEKHAEQHKNAKLSAPCIERIQKQREQQHQAEQAIGRDSQLVPSAAQDA